MLRVLAACALALALATAPAAAKSKHRGHHHKPRPDLVVARISKPPKSVTAGTKLKIKVKVKNRGKAKAKKSKLAVYLATGKKHTRKDRRLVRRNVKALSKGKKGATLLKLRVKLPSLKTSARLRLIACADDKHKVRESRERNNCRSTRKLTVVALAAPATPPTPSPPAEPTAPAFTLSDGIDWGWTYDSAGAIPEAGDPITATLTAANGFPGQAGYTRTDVAPQPLLSGSSTTITFPDPGTEDDGIAELTLPFEFPFGGVASNKISVSTNGWVSFGDPAWDYYTDSYDQSDYRGIDEVVGRFRRGIMPYWTDLRLGNPNFDHGSAKEVIAPDGSSVALQWEASPCCGSYDSSNAFTFQLVLFPDGRFRLDYPGTNQGTSNGAFIGYSLGTGAASLGKVGENVTTVPDSSILFTPKPLPSNVGSTPAGTTSLTLPAGSSLISADPGCSLTTAPGTFTDGLVTCDVPALAAPMQATSEVTFATPANAPGQDYPANFDLVGRYRAGASDLSDDEEVKTLSPSLNATDITLAPTYSGPNPPQVGTAATFGVAIDSPTFIGLDGPIATFVLPANTVLDSITSKGDQLDCDPPAGAAVTCRLPSGAYSMDIDIVVTPTAAALGNPMTLGVTAQALNAPEVSGSVDSPAVAED